MFVRLSVAIAALGLLTGAALAQGAKPTDPQIAHIAYTAGVIDIAAEETVTSVLNKAGTVEYYCRFHPNMKAVLTIVP
jgi:putative membrane protein